MKLGVFFIFPFLYNPFKIKLPTRKKISKKIIKFKIMLKFLIGVFPEISDFSNSPSL